MLKLMYITNNADIAEAAEASGVDRIFIDLETLDKKERQKGRNTFISTHSLEDVAKMRKVIKKAQLLVRVNPINPCSKEEINSVIENGADLIMLPMFKSRDEVETFVDIIDGRCSNILLLEHAEAVGNLNDILTVPGIEEFHIGLNDLHISMHRKFMFELLADGTTDRIVNKIKEKGYPVGIGGMSKLGTGELPAELILAEHYRLKSNGVILSRGFTEGMDVSSNANISNYFKENVAKIREGELTIADKEKEFFDESHQKLVKKVKEIVKGLGN